MNVSIMNALLKSTVDATAGEAAAGQPASPSPPGLFAQLLQENTEAAEALLAQLASAEGGTDALLQALNGGVSAEGGVEVDAVVALLSDAEAVDVLVDDAIVAAEASAEATVELAAAAQAGVLPQVVTTVAGSLAEANAPPETLGDGSAQARPSPNASVTAIAQVSEALAGKAVEAKHPLVATVPVTGGTDAGTEPVTVAHLPGGTNPAEEGLGTTPPAQVNAASDTADTRVAVAGTKPGEGSPPIRPVPPDSEGQVQRQRVGQEKIQALADDAESSPVSGDRASEAASVNARTVRFAGRDHPVHSGQGVVAAAHAGVDAKTAKAPSEPGAHAQGSPAAPPDGLDDAVAAASAAKPDLGTSSQGNSSAAMPEPGVQSASVVKGEPVPVQPTTQLSAAAAQSEQRSISAENRLGAGGTERPTLATLGEFAVKSVRYLVRGGQETISVRLIPDSLGEVHIAITSTDDGLEVELKSASSAVRSVLETQISVLRETLSRDGIDVTRAVVVNATSADSNAGAFGRSAQGHESARSHMHSQAATYRGTQTEPRAGSPRATRHMGSLDVFA